MLNYFLNLPIFTMCVIIILFSAVFSLIALLIIRKKLNPESIQENHEVGGFLFNALGLIYAVLVAFVVFATWDDYEAAQVNCDNEANTLQDIFLNSEGLPPSHQQGIKEKVVEYMESVINEDWPLLSEDKENEKSRLILLDMWKIYMSMDTLEDQKQSIFLTESLNRLNELTDYRRLRILSSQNHIPTIIWTVIIAGALTSVLFSLFFITKSFVAHVTMTSLFVMTNAIIMLLILNLDHPFTGDSKIKPEAFEQVLSYLKVYK
jgi:hypothetical protein